MCHYHSVQLRDRKNEEETETKRGADRDPQAIEEERRRALERSRSYDKRQKAAREAKEREDQEMQLKRSQLREERQRRNAQRRCEIYAMNRVMAAWGALQMARFNQDAGVEPEEQKESDLLFAEDPDEDATETGTVDEDELPSRNLVLPAEDTPSEK